MSEYQQEFERRMAEIASLPVEETEQCEWRDRGGYQRTCQNRGILRHHPWHYRPRSKDNEAPYWTTFTISLCDECYAKRRDVRDDLPMIGCFREDCESVFCYGTD
jgi:hypothetical protein